MPNVSATSVPGSAAFQSSASVTRIEYSPRRLLVFMDGGSKEFAVTFEAVLGFRVLDERDLSCVKNFIVGKPGDAPANKPYVAFGPNTNVPAPTPVKPPVAATPVLRSLWSSRSKARTTGLPSILTSKE